MAKGQIRFFYFANSNAYNSFISTSGFDEDYLYVIGDPGLIYKGNQLIAQSGTALFNAITEAVTAMQVEIEANEGRIEVLEGKVNTTIPSQLNNKVDKEDGKGLSEANFTQAEKEKLAGIEVGANKFSITIDDILSTTSTNPVQNKVIKEALDTKASTSLKINNHALTDSFNLTAEEVGADPEGTANAAIKAHNEDNAAHNSIQSKVDANTDNISKVSENLTIHIDNENVHLTDTDKNKINQAYAYSQKGHAEKSFSNVQIETTILSAESGTDTLILQAGDGVTLSADASTDTVTISSLDGVRSIETGTENGTISVDGNDVKVKGLTSMAYEDATTFTNNLKTAVKADVNTNLVEPHTSNTTIHVNEVDRAKWNDTSTNLNTHTGNASIHISSDEKSKLTAAYDHSQSTHASIIAEAVSEAKDYADDTFSVKGHNHDTDYYKKNEVDTKLNNKVDKTRVYQAHEITIQPNGPWDVLDDSTHVENMLLSADTEISDLKQRTSGVESSIKTTNSNLSSHTGNTSNPHKVDKTQIGLGDVENKSSATIRGEITKANVTTALGYTPYTQAEVNTLLSGKANSSHQQAASTITIDPLEHYSSSDVQTALEAMETDIQAMETDIQAMETGLNSKVPTSRTINGKALTGDIDLSASDVGASAEGHAHSNYVNQNAFSNVKIDSTTIVADSTTDTLTFVAGDGITLTPDATNDKITIANSGVRTVTTGSTNGTIAVNGTNVSVKGLGSAAYTASTAYDAAGTAANKANTAESNAKSYTDTKIADLINGAPSTLDTLGEIATAMANNQSVVEALEEAIGNKSNVGHNHDDRYYTESEINTKVNTLNSAISGKVSIVEGKGLSTNDYTTSEKNKLAGIASGAQVNQNAFSNIKVGTTTIEADTATDTLEIAGSNVTITPDATNDKVTISVASGSTSTKGIVKLSDATNSTSTSLAATANAVKKAYDLANTANTKANSAYTLAEGKVSNLSDLGITSSAAELNYTDGVTSNIQTQLNGKLPKSGGTITGPLTVSNSNSSESNGLFINRTGGSAEQVRHYIDDNRYHLVYTNDETTNSFLFEMISIDTENGDGTNKSTATVTFNNSGNKSTVTANTFNGSLSGNASTASKATADASGNTITTTYATKSELTTAQDTLQININKKSDEGHTHKYAGSSSAGGAATSANKLNTNAGNSTTPVYFEGGVPKALSYTIAKSVPSDAKFTDTNTHYASSTVTAGSATGTSNSTTALTNGNVYLNHIENGGVKSSHKISGSGATTVTADTSGNITIKSSNTTYKVATAEANGLMSKEDFAKLDGIEVGANNYTLPTATNTGILGGVKTTSTVTSASGHTPTPIIDGVPYYKDTNTTYTGSNGITLTGTNFTNSGVRSISTGSTNGTISVNTNGTSAEVAVKGLGSAAYRADSYFSKDGHTHNYAGSSSAGGAATSALKANTADLATEATSLITKAVGSTTVPVYFDGGVPKECSLSITDNKVKQTAVSSGSTAYPIVTGTSSSTNTGTVNKITTATLTGAGSLTVTELKLGSAKLSYDTTAGALVISFE